MISIITMAYNEEGNVIPLYERVKQAMDGMDYEFVAVDDGSTDNTWNELRRINDYMTLGSSCCRKPPVRHCSGPGYEPF